LSNIERVENQALRGLSPNKKAGARKLRLQVGWFARKNSFR
jgi:hypothetical protein